MDGWLTEKRIVPQTVKIGKKRFFYYKPQENLRQAFEVLSDELEGSTKRPYRNQVTEPNKQTAEVRKPRRNVFEDRKEVVAA